MKAIVDDKIPYIRGLIEELVDEVCYVRGGDIGPDDVRDAHILIVRTRTRVDERLLSGSQVGLVVTATIGYDHLDTAWLESVGIRWTNCPGCNAASVCQYVHNSLLSLDRLHEGMRAGIVGVGHVGSLVADDLHAAGMRVTLCDPPRFCTPSFAETDWSDMDLITFHTPLQREGELATWHMADDRFFQSLRRRPVVINAARGGVIDEAALLRAMDRGLVSAVVVDTWEGEPNINRELLRRADIATPHIAGYSADGKANATRMSLQAVADYLGVPFTLDVTPPALPPDFCYGGPSAEDTKKADALRLYDPCIDSRHLKSEPEKFEWLRGHYPLRRERM